MSFTNKLERARGNLFPLDFRNGRFTADICTDEAYFDKLVAQMYDEVFGGRTSHFSVSAERQKDREILGVEFETLHQERILVRDSDGEVAAWIKGEMEDPSTFYLRTAGVRPEYRNKGIANALYPQIFQYLRSLGYERVSSQHHPNNGAAMMLQLSLGFIVEGMNVDERWGPQVKMVKFLHEDRLREFERRFGLPEYSWRRG
jgi:ribosomal protein S18 acetylase RimI-like enzyme